MNIKLIKLQQNIKTKTKKSWYTLMKPLANILMRNEDNKYAKLAHKCRTMTDEELMKRFAKYITKRMIKNNTTKIEYIVFNKRGSYNRDLEEEQLIFNELRDINHSYRDKKLKNWKYHSDKAKLYFSFNDPDEQFPSYEKQLNILLKTELDKLGLKTEYIDIREEGYKNQGETYDFYGRYLDDIGYEKTLRIRL